MTAQDDLKALMANLPNAGLITDKQYTDALALALLPDSAGVWPGQDLYVETHDIYFAALQILPFLKAQLVVRSTSSEGTSIAVDAPDWASLTTYYQSQSPICNVQQSDLLAVLPIPGGPHVVKVDMSGRNVLDYDIDTDLH